MLPITLVGAGIGCGRYIDTVGECFACGEVARLFCSECNCCLECCECGEDEYEDEEFTAVELFEFTIEMKRIEMEEEKQNKCEESKE